MATIGSDCEFCFRQLRKNPLFEHIPEQHLLILAGNCSLISRNKGEDCINNENMLYHFYVIVNGKIKVYKLSTANKKLTLSILSEHDVFDVFPLINMHQHHVSYEILENMRLLAISMNLMRDWLLKSPVAMQALFKYTIAKFQLMETQMLDLGTNYLPARLANLLLHYYNLKTHQLEGIDKMTHDELSQLIGTSRAVFNRQIQEFKRAGIITVGRRHIEVVNYSLLLEISKSEDPFA